MQITLHEAERCLGDLLEAARRGERVVIVGPDGPVQLNAVTTGSETGPVAGFARGTFRVSDDFDAPLADFDDYTP
jgi:antitoxin (DNA-binding transcriptional repressor) of toxin-antitoxin stability system